MKEMLFAFGVLELHAPDLPPARPDGPDYVIDGDTLMIGGHRWRLDGYDAPGIRNHSRNDSHCEAEHALGLRAKARLEELIAGAAARGTLRIKLLNGSEKFKRQLVRIMVDDRDVGEILYEEGLAKPYNGRGQRPIFCNCPTKLAKIAAQEDDRTFRASQRVAEKRSAPRERGPSAPERAAHAMAPAAPTAHELIANSSSIAVLARIRKVQDF